MIVKYSVCITRCPQRSPYEDKPSCMTVKYYLFHYHCKSRMQTGSGQQLCNVYSPSAENFVPSVSFTTTKWAAVVYTKLHVP